MMRGNLMKELKLKIFTVLSALFIYCVLLIRMDNANAAPNYPCACGQLTAPEGVIIPANSGFYTNGSTILGTCDTANEYYGSCIAPTGYTARGSCTANNTVVFSCDGSDWVATSNPCGKANCSSFDNSTINTMGAKPSGWNGEVDCDSIHRNPPRYYCLNGTWSYNNSDGVCDLCPKDFWGNRNC